MVTASLPVLGRPFRRRYGINTSTWKDDNAILVLGRTTPSSSLQHHYQVVESSIGSSSGSMSGFGSLKDTELRYIPGEVIFVSGPNASPKESSVVRFVHTTTNLQYDPSEKVARLRESYHEFKLALCQSHFWRSRHSGANSPQKGSWLERR